MINKNELPPYIHFNEKVILFDGVCKLCNSWSRFIIKYDSKHIFKLALVQSKEGKSILKHFGLPTDYYDTILYIDGNEAYLKSTAFLKIVRLLPFPIKLLSFFGIAPKPLRDWIYDRIALNRYRLFGEFEQCILPSADHEKRFL